MTDPVDQAGRRLASSFGYQEVPPEDKTKLVGGVFARVATRYDLMNDLMSGGIHRLWKAAMIDWLAPQPGIRLLDVAGGTGDIAFRVLDRLERRGGAPPLIVVSDVNPAMLEVGRDRAIDANRLEAVGWLCADAEALPLPARSFDAYTVAFGIRNVTRIERALAEARRVLKPGGRFYAEEVLARFIHHPVWRRLLDHPMEDRFDHDQFRAALIDAGFDVVGSRELWGQFAWFVADRPVT
jgi:demethylmenaquinone methyltransferase/2-methoxy-6-polyprenyl-1,4-benzoquinol methylase